MSEALAPPRGAASWSLRLLALCALALLSIGCGGGAPPRLEERDRHYSIAPAFSGISGQVIAHVESTAPSLVRIQSEAKVFKPLSRYLLGIADGLASILNPHPYWEWPYRVVGFPFYLLFGHLDLSSSRGSGFFVREDLVLTNAHVVDNAAEITLQLTDGRVAAARVRVVDTERDLALLEVEGLSGPAPPPLVLRPARVGFAPGEVVIALGFPGRDALDDPFMPTFAVDEDRLIPNPRVTVGVLSATSVELGNLRTRYLEIDAALNPGNSGGPVLGLDGRVIGVATMIGVGKENEGYAVPSHSVLEAFAEHLTLSNGQGEPETGSDQSPPK